MTALPEKVLPIIAVLERGAFHELIGQSEEAYLDAKERPYFTNGQTANDRQKAEFAKDVAAFANANGGIILVGVRATKNAHTKREVVADILDFPQADVDVEQCQKILTDWLVPPVSGLEVRWYRSSTDAKRGIVAIIVPGLAERDGPFLTRKSVDDDGKTDEVYFAIYTRRGTDNRAQTVGSLQAQLRAGKLNDRLFDRLTAIEEKLAELPKIPAPIPTEKVVAPIRPDVSRQRIDRGKLSCQREGLPNIILVATPTTGTSFPTLFRAPSDPVVQLFNNLPVFRQSGFDISTNNSSVIVDGKMRQSVAAEYAVIELWKDGMFMAIGPADYQLLCWAKPEDATKGLPLRNFVLSEVVLNFVTQAAALYQYANPLPAGIEFHLELADVTKPNGQRATLSVTKDNPKYFPGREYRKDAPDNTFSTNTVAAVANENPLLDIGKATYELLSQLYVRFGFHEGDTPYTDESQKRITPSSLLGVDYQQ